MKNYETFAPFYDLVMGDRPDVARAIHRQIKRTCPRAENLLELGCGSGTFLKYFNRYYTTSGIDLSSSMISIARKKVPGAELSVGDITRFDLGRKFDAIVCAFDTMNHLKNFTEWRKVFRNAHRHLNPGGVFIFDINTEFKLNRYWSESPTATHRENSVSTFEVFRLGKGRYRVEVRVFEKEKDGRYTLHEMHVPEVTYSVEQTLKALAVHFGKVRLLDLERPRATGFTEELYFVCSKPK